MLAGGGRVGEVLDERPKFDCEAQNTKRYISKFQGRHNMMDLEVVGTFDFFFSLRYETY